ncbi:MAG TPA: hypothetical protein DCK95_10755 [Anaerolineaceae bacterium]|nr:hypothetical protein [Anaerolineaceae bacterium]
MSDQLNAKQQLAIELALEGLTDNQIAQRVGVSRQRVNIWRNQDVEFMQTLQERRQLLREVHLAQLLHMVGAALEVLRTAMESEDENTRLRAAISVLKLAGLQNYASEKQEDTARAALLQALKEIAQEMERG